MIRINLLTPEQAELVAQVAWFYRVSRIKSYSERHPELGKMVDCWVCDRRHRSSIKCEPQYSVNRWTKEVMIAPKTRKGVNGAAQFKGKRILPHRNQMTQLVTARANALFNAAVERAGQVWQPDFARYVRQALQEIRAKREARRYLKHQQQKTARRINFGLIPGPDGNLRPRA